MRDRSRFGPCCSPQLPRAHSRLWLVRRLLGQVLLRSLASGDLRSNGELGLRPPWLSVVALCSRWHGTCRCTRQVSALASGVAASIWHTAHHVDLTEDRPPWNLICNHVRALSKPLDIYPRTCAPFDHGCWSEIARRLHWVRRHCTCPSAPAHRSPSPRRQVPRTWGHRRLFIAPLLPDKW